MVPPVHRFIYPDRPKRTTNQYDNGKAELNPRCDQKLDNHKPTEAPDRRPNHTTNRQPRHTQDHQTTPICEADQQADRELGEIDDAHASSTAEIANSQDRRKRAEIAKVDEPYGRNADTRNPARLHLVQTDEQAHEKPLSTIASERTNQADRADGYSYADPPPPTSTGTQTDRADLVLIHPSAKIATNAKTPTIYKRRTNHTQVETSGAKVPVVQKNDHACQGARNPARYDGDNGAIDQQNRNPADTELGRVANGPTRGNET